MTYLISNSLHSHSVCSFCFQVMANSFTPIHTSLTLFLFIIVCPMSIELYIFIVFLQIGIYIRINYFMKKIGLTFLFSSAKHAIELLLFRFLIQFHFDYIHCALFITRMCWTPNTKDSTRYGKSQSQTVRSTSERLTPPPSNTHLHHLLHLTPQNHNNKLQCWDILLLLKNNNLLLYTKY